jgi:hypothetical protein
MILAVLNKPTGRGGLRCWRAFLFDTNIQSYVEQFMQDVFQGGNYFLMAPDELERNEVGNMMLNGIWIAETPVHVKARGVRMTFTIKD